MNLGNRGSLVMASLLLAGPQLATAATTKTELSRSAFLDRLSSANLVAYEKFHAGDSLPPGPHSPNGQQELYAGVSPSSISQSAQYEWPDNWMSSTFVLSYTASTKSLSLQLTSSDPNGNPRVAAVSMAVNAPFDELAIGATTTINAMYLSGMTFNGVSVGNLSPNANVLFQGFSLGNLSPSVSFVLNGSVYFDGGTQTGESNRMEALLLNASAVPETSTAALLAFGLMGIAAVATVRRPFQSRDVQRWTSCQKVASFLEEDRFATQATKNGLAA